MTSLLMDLYWEIVMSWVEGETSDILKSGEYPDGKKAVSVIRTLGDAPWEQTWPLIHDLSFGLDIGVPGSWHRDVVDLFETIFFGWQARHERRWQNLKPKSQNLIVTNLLNALGPYPGNVAFSPLLVALVDLETRDGKFDTLKKLCDMVEDANDLKSRAAQCIIATLSGVTRGYPIRATPVYAEGYPIRVNPFPRGWFDGPSWQDIPSEFSDRLLNFCLKEGTDITLLLSGTELILRNATPERAEALLKKILATTNEDSEGEEEKENEGDEKKKRKRRRFRIKTSKYHLSEDLVPRLIKLPAFKGKLLPLLESMKFTLLTFPGIVTNVSITYFDNWQKVVQEELHHPSSDLPFILDFIHPPSPSEKPTFFSQAILQVAKLFADKDNNSEFSELMARMSPPTTMVPRLTSAIATAINLARRHGRDPLDTILSILDSYSPSPTPPEVTESSSSSSSSSSSPSPAFCDRTKFLVATVLASTSGSARHPTNVDSRVTHLLESLSHCIPSIPSQILLFPMKQALALCKQQSVIKRPDWIDQCLATMEFSPQAAFRLVKWGVTLPESWEPQLKQLLKGTSGWVIMAAIEQVYSKLVPWTPSQHRCFLRPFRLAVRELLLIHARLRREQHQPMEIEQEKEKEKGKEQEKETGGGISFGSLPVMVLHVIFGHLARGYADKTLPDFLMKDLDLDLEGVDLVLQEVEVKREAPLFWSLIGYHSAWDLAAILGKQPEEKIEGPKKGKYELNGEAERALKMCKSMLTNKGLDTEGTPDEIAIRLRAAMEAHSKKGDEEDEEGIAVSDLTVAELRYQLKLRGLDNKGDKATLVKRLAAAVEAESSGEEEEEVDDETMAKIFATLPVADLRGQLKRFGLDTKGTKAVLVQRLMDFMAEGKKKSEEDAKKKRMDKIASMPMAKLREFMKSVGLDNKGTRDVLIKRLAAAMDEKEEEGEKEKVAMDEEDEADEKKERIDPASMTVADLREQLKARGLDTKGTKAVLVKRLASALEEDEGEKAAVVDADEGEKEKAAMEEDEEDKDEGEKESIDPASMTVADLRKHLKARGLDTKGTKAVLIKRLTASLTGGEGENEEAALEEEDEEDEEEGKNGSEKECSEGGESSQRKKRRASQMKKSEEEKKAAAIGGQRGTKRAPPRKKPTNS